MSLPSSPSRYRHPKVLTLLHPVEESPDTLAFATEPCLGSLANVLGCLEERLPQHAQYEARGYQFLNFELKYGLSQVSTVNWNGAPHLSCDSRTGHASLTQLTEALLYLHGSCKIVHRNLSPQSVVITRRGTWKLTGFEFTEKCAEPDIMVSDNGTRRSAIATHIKRNLAAEASQNSRLENAERRTRVRHFDYMEHSREWRNRCAACVISAPRHPFATSL